MAQKARFLTGRPTRVLWYLLADVALEVGAVVCDRWHRNAARSRSLPAGAVRALGKALQKHPFLFSNFPMSVPSLSW